MYTYIINRAKEIGFDLCGIAKADAVEEGVVDFVEDWISTGHSASLDWMYNNKELRYNPTKLPDTNVKSIVVCGISYHTLDTLLQHPIANYAHGADYHYIIKELLNKLKSDIEIEYNITIEARAFSDSAPILERYWAVKSGLGWIGKSSMLINKDFGSYFLIGTLLLDIDFERYDTTKEFNRCGECRKCIDNCLSGAISKNKSIDCNKCLSYITIEHRGEYTEQQKEVIRLWDGSSIFGCDRCQSVCPWNIKAHRNITREISDKRDNILHRCSITDTIDEWRLINSSEFKKLYKHSALSRAGHKKISATLDVLDIEKD